MVKPFVFEPTDELTTLWRNWQTADLDMDQAAGEVTWNDLSA